MRRLRALFLFAGIAFVCIAGGATWGWIAMTRALEREGARVGVVGCILPAGPAADWSVDGRRDFVWLALLAPDWLVGGEPEEVREGAERVLRRSVRAEDAERVRSFALAGRYDARAAGVQLGLVWLARGESFRVEARELLDGDAREQALALLALPVVTGRRLEDVAPSQARWTLRDVDVEARLERTFGAPRAALVDEWRAWLELHDGPTLAELHTELVARWWTIEELEPRQELWCAQVGHRFACIDGLEPAWARRAAGPAAATLSRVDWYADEEFRNAAIERLRAQQPVALDAATILDCIEFTVWSGLF